MMAKIVQLPPQAELNLLLRYEPNTGRLYWLERQVEWFDDGRLPAERHCRWWNTMYAGKEAMYGLNIDGYRYGTIWGKPYFAHRIIWMMAYGENPNVINHISGVRTDNRLQNLRSVARLDVARNAGISQNNTSGYVGVSWNKNNKKWQARITRNGERINLGFFKKKEDAIAARKKADIDFGYHENHGRLHSTARYGSRGYANG